MEFIELKKIVKIGRKFEEDEQPKSNFLQSEKWSELLRKEGREIFEYGVIEGEINQPELIATVRLIKKFLGGGYFYFYAPRGPVFKKRSSANQRAISNQELELFLFSGLKRLYPRLVFIRIEPEEVLELRIKKIETEKFGAKSIRARVENKFKIKKTLDLQPAKTLILDLKKDEEEILKAMQAKTRYNLRLAQKKGVKIIEVTKQLFPDLGFSEFWRLASLTSERDNFRLHDAKHYKNLIENGGEFIKLYLAEYQGKYLAAGLFCFFSGQVTYLHGASDNDYRNVMAPYLLHFEVIKQARAAGYEAYDFYGIDEKKWPGVTRFKKGFGGELKTYPGTFDLIFNPGIYWFYNFLRKIIRRS